MTMTTTAKNLTNDQIRALRSEAAQAGDSMQVAICDVALEWGAKALTQAQIDAGERDYCDLRGAARAKIHSMTHEEAVALVVEALNAAEVQGDECGEDVRTVYVQA